ncbi:MAG: adenylyltransferase/cytidyltransferase family protein, partial [Bacteriovoracaceae bacterium]|nr:adenylyltransferase/cytidyltransferase family protein [Bacteriovoracaceae bacterium]
MQQRVLYPGSFDPFPNGHAALIKRALEIFPAMTILVAVSG